MQFRCSEIPPGLFRWLALTGIFALASCANNGPQAPDFGKLYSTAAMQHGPDRNPVIVIPGILGSKLVDKNSGNVVWGVVGKGSADPDTPEGLRQMALPMQTGVPLRQLNDEVMPEGALESLDVRLFGIARLQPEAYASILKALGAGGYTDQTLGESGAIDYGGNDHYTCFQFGYDWRRSLPENARLLSEFITEKRAEVSAEHRRRFGAAGAGPVKFDIVAHSMGCLLTRYYLRYGDQPLPSSDRIPAPTWKGAPGVEKIILVAPPNAGSLYALKQLQDGLKYPLIHEYPAAMLGTMPAIYQLLPRARHSSVLDSDRSTNADPLDIAFWERHQLGLLNPAIDDQLALLLPDAADRSARREVARRHLDKCLTEARRFHAALDQPATPPSSVQLSLFVGDGVETPRQAVYDPDKATFEFTAREAGDGTVTRSSALLDERRSDQLTQRLISPIKWHDIDFIPQDHLGVTRDPVFIDNILFTLLEKPMAH